MQVDVRGFKWGRSACKLILRYWKYQLTPNRKTAGILDTQKLKIDLDKYIKRPRLFGPIQHSPCDFGKSVSVHRMVQFTEQSYGLLAVSLCQELCVCHAVALKCTESQLVA